MKIRCVKIAKMSLCGNKSKLAILSAAERFGCHSLACGQVRCQRFACGRFRCFSGLAGVGKYTDCANRCYYAMMFSLKALLENQGKLAAWKVNELKEAETHNSLDSGFDDLVTQGLLDSSNKAAFEYVKDQRWKCDYSLYKFERLDAENCLRKTQAFYVKVETITA